MQLPVQGLREKRPPALRETPVLAGELPLPLELTAQNEVQDMKAIELTREMTHVYRGSLMLCVFCQYFCGGPVRCPCCEEDDEE